MFRRICVWLSSCYASVLRFPEDALHGHEPGEAFIELVEPRVYKPLFGTFTGLHSEIPDAGKRDATVNVLALSWSPDC